MITAKQARALNTGGAKTLTQTKRKELLSWFDRVIKANAINGLEYANFSLKEYNVTRRDQTDLAKELTRRGYDCLVINDILQVKWDL